MTPKDTGEMPTNAQLAAITMKVCELLDREGLQPHTQIFVLAHAYSSCANALGLPVRDAQLLVGTRYEAVERFMKTAPADARAYWDSVRDGYKKASGNPGGHWTVSTEDGRVYEAETEEHLKMFIRQLQEEGVPYRVEREP